MEFLKALHEAERYGVTRDAFMSIWQREAELNQKREDARILDLKQSLAMAEHQVSDTRVKQMKRNMNLIRTYHTSRYRSEDFDDGTGLLEHRNIIECVQNYYTHNTPQSFFHFPQSTDPAVISQVEQMMYNLCQQVNLSLQQMCSFLAQEIGDMKKQVLEVASSDHCHKRNF